MPFQKVNSNPSKRKRGDCVVRALVLGLRAKWLVVFDELVMIAREIYAMPNEKDVYAELLHRHGWHKMPMPRFPDNTRYTVAEFAKAHPTGTLRAWCRESLNRGHRWHAVRYVGLFAQIRRQLLGAKQWPTITAIRTAPITSET